MYSVIQSRTVLSFASRAYSILSICAGVFVMIDNTVRPVPASLNDENLDEEEGGFGVGGGGLFYCLTHSRQQLINLKPLAQMTHVQPL